MRIVIATAVFYPMINGVAMFSWNLARGLKRRGHEVMVICPSQEGRRWSTVMEGVRVEYLHSVQAKVYPDQIHEVPEKHKVLGMELPQVFYKYGLPVSVFPRAEVAELLDEFHPDVVHVQVSDPIGLSVVAAARKRGIPVVTTEHSQPEVFTEPLGVPKFIKKPVNALLAAYFVNRQSKSDFVTMPTELAIRNLLRGRKESIGVPIAAVSNGVDLEGFHPGVAGVEVRRRYGVPEGVPVVLYVGRVDRVKNVEGVVNAFEEFLLGNKLDRLSKTCLVVVGDGVDKARLEGLVREKGLERQVLFLGRVVGDELGEIYRIGDVFATASPIETQGIVLIEAAASGLPLIAVNAGAVAEICVDGENGVLCEVGDVKAMAEAMGTILGDDVLRQKYAKKSVELAQEHDMEKTLERFENIYRRVVGH